MLLSPEERARVKGLIINKFRGDIELLKPGLDMFKAYVDIPVVGVLPYIELAIEDRAIFSDEKIQAREFSKVEDLLRKNLDMDFIYRLVKR